MHTKNWRLNDNIDKCVHSFILDKPYLCVRAIREALELDDVTMAKSLLRLWKGRGLIMFDDKHGGFVAAELEYLKHWEDYFPNPIEPQKASSSIWGSFPRDTRR